MRQATQAITIMITNTETNLLRLMQLSSASLPVGGYSFSQGLEFAVDAGWICNAEQTFDWCELLFEDSVAVVDLPLLIRLADAIKNKDSQKFIYWNATVLACRETSELSLTETAMGAALIRLLRQLEIDLSVWETILDEEQISFIAAFALAANYWKINDDSILVGYCWSWLENQIAAATKLVPLGQTAAQKLLISLGDSTHEVIAQAKMIDDGDIGASLPGLAMASAWHETQYSRLFRS
jgi:urease accessory protein